MQFPQQLITEITAPNNVPFLPGNTVTGFGTDIPPELTAIGFTNSIVFYDTDWDPAATTPKVKFRFIASGPSVLQIGYGYCNNPSVSQTATVVTVYSIGANISGANIDSISAFRNKNNITTFLFGEYFGSSDPVLEMFDNGGVARCILQHIASNSTSSLIFGNWQLNCLDGASTVAVNNPIVFDTAWQPFTLFNGWTGAAAPNAPLYRVHSTGLVSMTGIIQKASAPVNGEKWGQVAAAYLPKGIAAFNCPSGLTATGGQKVQVNTGGDCVIFDAPAGNGSCYLTPVNYPSTLLP